MAELLVVYIIGRRLYGDSICFANVDFFRINSVDTSEQIFTKPTHDVYRLAIKHYEEIFWTLARHNFGTPKTTYF